MLVFLVYDYTIKVYILELDLYILSLISRFKKIYIPTGFNKLWISSCG